MQDWCQRSAPQHIAKGDYWEARISPIHGTDLHADEAFMDALALKVMGHYESNNAEDDTLFLPHSVVVPQERTKTFYRSLFNDDGTFRQDFCTEASETLGLWIEQSLEGALYAKRGIPHNSDFGFDVLSIVSDDQPFLRVVQVKATKDRLYDRCRDAVVGFGRLHDGDYHAVLKAQLDIMKNDRRAPADINFGELFFRRHYRIITVHEQDRDGLTLLTNFETLTPGSAEQRTLRLVRVIWADFWETLAGKIYARLS